MNISMKKVNFSGEQIECQIVFLIYILYFLLDLDTGESRLLGLVMIPGRHIISIHTDVHVQTTNEPSQTTPNVNET